MQGIVTTHGNKIMALEKRNELEDVATKAVAEYKEKERSDTYVSTRTAQAKDVRELIKYLIPFIIAATLFIYAVTKN